MKGYEETAFLETQKKRSLATKVLMLQREYAERTDKTGNTT